MASGERESVFFSDATLSYLAISSGKNFFVLVGTICTHRHRRVVDTFIFHYEFIKLLRSRAKVVKYSNNNK